MSYNQFSIAFKTVFFSFFLYFSSVLYAISPATNQSYYNHLLEVNKEWKFHKSACLDGNVSFKTDADRIQLHLYLVIKELRTTIPKQLTQSQKNNRLYLLEKLKEYADQKVFPVNKYHSVRQPYFVDDYGTNCAVGQMIDVSGHQDLVAKISKEHNYDYIKDIKTEGLTEWAEEYGFLIDELKWIQPGYPPTANIQQLSKGTDGKVNKIYVNNYSGGLLIGGEFTELDSLPCLNVGMYKDNQLACLGEGIAGKVTDVGVYEDAVYAFGELHHNGQVFPMARFVDDDWEFISIPDRIGATSTVSYQGFSPIAIEIAIHHESLPNQQEIWSFSSNNGTWQKVAKANGVILAIEASGYGRIYAGHFDSVMVYNTSLTNDTALSVNNIVFRRNYDKVWYGISGAISDTIYTIKESYGTVYFGGSCHTQTEESKVLLSRYFNGVLQPMLYANEIGIVGYSEYSAIKTIGFDYSTPSLLYLGGDFNLQPMVGIYGKKFATYNIAYNSLEALANFDKAVNTIVFNKGTIYFGGEFQYNMGNSINYLGFISNTTSVDKLDKSDNLGIYPNPFSSVLNIDNLEDDTPYFIFNLEGQLVHKGIVMNGQIDGLGFLPKGEYLLQIETSKGRRTKKLVK